MGEPRKSLAQQLDEEAREAAEAYFGPNATAAQRKRVHDCEWSMFTYHCSTGDDLDCVCGAHASLLRPYSAENRGQDR